MHLACLLFVFLGGFAPLAWERAYAMLTRGCSFKFSAKGISMAFTAFIRAGGAGGQSS